MSDEKKLEVTDKELDCVSGGYIPPQKPTQSQSTTLTKGTCCTKCKSENVRITDRGRSNLTHVNTITYHCDSCGNEFTVFNDSILNPTEIL